MRRQKRFFLFGVLLFMCSSSFFLGFLRPVDEDVTSSTPVHRASAPWGRNYHAEVQHLHGDQLNVQLQSSHRDTGADAAPPSAKRASVTDNAGVSAQAALRLQSPSTPATTTKKRKKKPNYQFGRGFDSMSDYNGSSFSPVPGGAPAYVAPPRVSRIWPTTNETEDRILTQMNLQPARAMQSNTRRKLILVYNGLPAWERGSQKLISDQCPVQNCLLTDDVDRAPEADAILWQQTIRKMPTHARRPDQIWIYFQLEAPEHSVGLKEFSHLFNWTATYRLDSTINTPYERFIPFRNATKMPPEKTPRNYAKGKTKLVAWFVSNCAAENGRSQYVQELNKHIPVDIYGSCGTLHCPRGDARKCNDMLNTDYKFYLAFENSNCRDYITEKLYWNALYNDVVPVVMGAHPDDYRRVAPPNSYIHVDDFESPAQLAEFLRKLDADDDLYSQYFRWKGTGEFINTKFWCRMCSLVHQAHEEDRHSWYGDLQKWWRGPGTCVGRKAGKRWSTWRGDTSRAKMLSDAEKFVHTLR